MLVKGIELSGLAVTDFEFAVNSKGVIITCNYNNTHTKESELIKLYFNGVENIRTNLKEISDSTDIKIISAELEDLNDKQKAGFRFSAGPKNPEITLNFDYSTVHYSW